MKIGIPTNKGGLGDVVYEHFGRAPTFTIVDTDEGYVEVMQNRGEHMGGVGHPSEFLIEERVDVVICRGLGLKALRTFKKFGVEVYLCEEGTVKENIDMLERGLLRLATEMDRCERDR